MGCYGIGITRTVAARSSSTTTTRASSAGAARALRALVVAVAPTRSCAETAERLAAELEAAGVDNSSTTATSARGQVQRTPT